MIWRVTHTVGDGPFKVGDTFTMEVKPMEDYDWPHTRRASARLQRAWQQAKPRLFPFSVFEWWRRLNEAIKLVPLIHANSSLCLSVVEAIRKELSAMTQEVQALQDSTAALTDAVSAVASAIHAGIDEIQQLIGKVQESINSGTAELPKVKEAADEIMRQSLALRDAANALNAAKAASDAAFPDAPPAEQSEGTAPAEEGEQPPAEDAPAS